MSQDQLKNQADHSASSPDAGLMSKPNSLEGRLSRAFSALVHGRLYPGSEGDTPYEPFHILLDPARAVTADALREAMGLASWWIIDLRDGEAWFDEIIAAAKEDDSFDDPDVYELLRCAMHGTLQGPVQRATVRAPDSASFHKTRQIIFGRITTGALAGLIAFSVET